VASDPFKIRDHVPAFDAIVQEIRARSVHARQTLRCALDVAFGQGSDERLDLFFPEGMTSRRPIHLFVHGGYWRMFSKDDYSYVADTVTEAGSIAAIVDYTLMPKVRMATLVDQVRRAADWLLENAASFDGDASNLTISGHSAGAHLAAVLLSNRVAKIRRALLLGGLYDLEPLRGSFLQAEIGLTEEEVSRFSPLNLSFPVSLDVRLLVGEIETSPFHAQAQRFRTHLSARGSNASLQCLAGADHMSSVRDLGVSTSQAGLILRSLCCHNAA
jgi:arylformamidase